MPVMVTEKTSIDYDLHGEGLPLILIGGLGFGRWAFFKQVPASHATLESSPSTLGASGPSRAASRTSPQTW